MKKIKKILGMMLCFFMIITTITPQAANKENDNGKSGNDTNSVIEIPLQWSRNTTGNVIEGSFDKNNMLEEPETGHNPNENAFRTNYIMNDYIDYTIDYRTMEKWLGGIKNGNIQESLPVKINNWEDNRLQTWEHSYNTIGGYKKQDWNLIRGYVDFNAIKDEKGNKINPKNYEFYLGAPKSHSMFIGANDLISVFVDEMPTEINYSTQENNKTIKFIDGNGKVNDVTFKREYQRWHSDHDRNCIAKDLLDDIDLFYGNQRGIDGWHVDLNGKTDKDGNTPLGDVTSIIRGDKFKGKHYIDLLTGEWCGNGGVTKLSLYAVKKPEIKVEKIAYVKGNDKDKISYKYKKTTESNGDVLLNTDNGNIPEVPGDVTVYFKFKVTNTGGTGAVDITNLSLEDKSLGLNFTCSKDTVKDSEVNNKNYLEALPTGKSITIKNEKELKFKPSKYSQLGKTYENKVNVSGKYFSDQIDITGSDTIKFKIKEGEPNINIEKKIVSINRNGSKIENVGENPIIMAGDRVNFKITISNNTSVGDNYLSVDGVSLSDELNCGKYKKSNWNFKNNDNNFKNDFAMSAKSSTEIRTHWKVPEESSKDYDNLGPKGVNTATVTLEDYNKSSSVDFNFKVRKGTIKVKKVVENPSDEDKERLFTINLRDENGNILQSVSLKNGQTGEFMNLDYGRKYKIDESVPTNYECDSISHEEFTMNTAYDGKIIDVNNSKKSTNFFDFVTDKINELNAIF